MTLPRDAYSSAAIRQFERTAIDRGIAGYTLMQRAGAAALGCLRRRWPDARRIVVVAGTGNNGGDGLVLARLARSAGIDCRVLLLGEASAMRGEAAEALRDLRAAGMDVARFDAAGIGQADVVVDALLGLGVRAPLLPVLCDAIEALNHCGAPVFSLDLPSGLDPDQGLSLPAVKATATLTFLGLKQGLLLGAGPEHAGFLEFDALGLTDAGNAAPASAPAPVLRLLDAEVLAQALPPRRRDSHKSQFGRVLVVGGGEGMAGAARLAGESALRVGAGLVTVASHAAHLQAIVGARPELMFLPVGRGADLAATLARFDVIAIGPGMGRDAWARDLLTTVLEQTQSRQRLVLDADALNIVAEDGALRREDWILTPHPGEASRLLGCPGDEVQSDRPAALERLVRARGGIVVLKGAGTLVGRAGEVSHICLGGNPGMAVPGMGDVLTGAIAGVLAQGADPFLATCAAVQTHAMAGDLCAARGVRGLLALEVAQALRDVLAPLP